MTLQPSNDISWRCINTIRVLAADVVQKAKSGHPGAPMGLAPLAHVLFSKHMKMNPLNSNWINRDRFVLSNGHACALQYVMLHLLGYKISMEDLKKFRQIDSVTPGHPECHMTDGIEVSTGPLGQGVSNAVGLAMAEAHMAAKYNRPQFDLFDHYTFCIVGDGCLQEGIASEAMSLAGHLKLSKLIIFYDDNHIQIDGSTHMAFTEDVLKRVEAYGFYTQDVSNGDDDLESIEKAIMNAKKETKRPSFIKIRTTIGKGSMKQGTEKVHGAALGEDDLKHVKKVYGFPENETFIVPKDVKLYYEDRTNHLMKQEEQWQRIFSQYEAKFPDLAKELKRRLNKELPQNWKSLLPKYKIGDSPIASRKMSNNVLNCIANHLPEIMGGSADLTESNLTKWDNSVDFQPDGKWGSYEGRYIRFGVREHAMCAIVNGFAAYGGFIPFGATFLNFITYAWGSVRLCALSHFQGLFIMTHDSIGLGEDGPTHQPVETLALMRSLPNLLVLRPADGNEVNGAYAVALENRTRPSVICLSRQNLPTVLSGSSMEKVYQGAYVLQKSQKARPDIILVSTGSEVSIIVEANAILVEKHDIAVQLVSMPSWELFAEQSQAYKESVFAPGVPVLSLEAATTVGWSKYAHASIGMQSFGTSAPYKDIYSKFGFTAEGVAKRALCTIEHFKTAPVALLMSSPF